MQIEFYAKTQIILKAPWGWRDPEQLIVLAALAESLVLIPNIHMAIHNDL